jgi:hypothetical protein
VAHRGHAINIKRPSEFYVRIRNFMKGPSEFYVGHLGSSEFYARIRNFMKGPSQFYVRAFRILCRA